MRPTRFLPALALSAGLVLTACGGDDSSSTSSDQPATTVEAPSGSVAAGTTVDANTASKAEIAAALDAAGVPNAEKWADEITEYRPYATDDPTFAKLREELAKYNPADGVIDQIIAVLSL